MLLVDDPVPEIARAAEATLAALPRESLAAFLARSDVTAEMRDFFAARGVEPAVGVGASDEPMIDTAPEPEASGDGDKRTTVQRIAAMSVAQRVSLAMKGTREERGILIRDSNKLVAVAVLSSPKLTESEVESIARMASVSEEILRIIAQNRVWTKNYAVVAALAKNPKTPVPIAMNLLARLNDRDLRAVSTDRNVADIVRITARQKLVITK